MERVHGIAPAVQQRAAILSILSFIFFLAMLVAFSLRQSLGYFLLAAAFLVVQIFTLTGWIMQRRAELKLYENGFTYKKHVCSWSEIESVSINKGNNANFKNCEIVKTNGEKIILTEAINGIENVAERIKHEVNKANKNAANTTY